MKYLFAVVVTIWALVGIAAPLPAVAGEWFALVNNNGWWTSNLEHPATKALEPSGKEADLKCLAFTPENDWVLLYGRNKVRSSNMQLPAVQKMLSLDKDADVRCVAFTPTGGSVVFWNESDRWHTGNVPGGALEKIAEVGQTVGTLRSISFSPTGGWVLLFGTTGVYYENVPDDLAKLLADEVQQRATVQCVAFTATDDWIVLASNGWWSSNPAMPVAKKLAKLAGEGQRLKWVAMTPDDPTKTRYQLVTHPSRTVQAALTVDFAHPGAKVNEWIIYAPEVPNLPGQHPVHTTFTPAAKIVRESSSLHRAVNLARLTDKHNKLHAVLNIEATLHARRLVPVAPEEKPPAVADLSPDDVRRYTRNTVSLDLITPAFKKWLQAAKLERKPEESDLAFARRAFAYIKHNCTYEFPSKALRVAEVCADNRSDCGGLSFLLIAVLRANKIPARALGGRWASPQLEADKGQWHVKAEFFAKGVGWIPADMSLAVSDKSGGDFAFFGNDAGDFIAFADDLDFQFDTFHFGKKYVGVLQGINHWWTGSGEEKEPSIQEWWTVADEPPAPVEKPAAKKGD